MNNKEKKRFAINVSSGVATHFVHTVVGFILMPYIIHRLGQEGYGIYQLANSMLVLFMLLQAGMSPMLIRFCSQAVAAKDFIKIQRVTSTGQLILGFIGLIGMLLGLILVPAFIDYYAVPDNLILGTKWLFAFMAIALLLNMLLIVPQGVVFSVNRYDLANGLEILSYLVRLGLIIFFFELFHPSLALLGLALFCSMLIRFIGLYILAIKHIGSSMVLSFKLIDVKTVKSMLSFSMQTFINTIAGSVIERSPVLIIGRVYDTTAVTAFSPALLIASGLRGFLSQAARPLTPLASKEVYSSKTDRRGRWSINISQLITTFGFLVLMPLVVYGYELMTIWLGSNLADNWVVAVVFSSGIMLSQTQIVNLNIALGSSTISPFVNSRVLTAVILLAGLIIGTVIFQWYLLEMSIFIAICLCVRNVVYLPWVGSKLFSYRYIKYLRDVFFKPLVVFCIVAIFGYILKTRFFPLDNYLMLITIPALLALFIVLCYIFVLNSDIKSTLLNLFTSTRLSHLIGKGQK